MPKRGSPGKRGSNDDTPKGPSSRRRSGEKPADDAQILTDQTTGISLRDAAQIRYLNYSLSVITSRALPDVRDGLKPFSVVSFIRWISKG